MFSRVRFITGVCAVASLAMVGTAAAQLDFTIDPTEGRPGDTVSGQVDPDDVAEHCPTTPEELQAVFNEVFAGPFAGGATEGDLFSRIFPGGEFVFETCDQAAYSLTGFVIFAIALNAEGATDTALPQTFVMTFVDPLTLDPIGERGNFDPVTGAGSVLVPEVDPGQYPVVATCVRPSLNVDTLEAGLRENGAFLEELGFPTCDINAPEFAAHVEELLGPGADILAFLSAFGPDLLESIVEPGALGLQLFTVLAEPQTTDECKQGGWQQFGSLGFRNQGDCVSFVASGGRSRSSAPQR